MVDSHSFQNSKLAITQAHVFALPDFTKPSFIKADASGFDIGAVLQQNGHLIAHFNKKFCRRLQNASKYYENYML